MIKITIKPVEYNEISKLKLLLIYAFMLLPFARMSVDNGWKVRRLHDGKFHYKLRRFKGEVYLFSCFEGFMCDRLKTTELALRYHRYDSTVLTFGIK